MYQAQLVVSPGFWSINSISLQKVSNEILSPVTIWWLWQQTMKIKAEKMSLRKNKSPKSCLGYLSRGWNFNTLQLYYIMGDYNDNNQKPQLNPLYKIS